MKFNMLKIKSNNYLEAINSNIFLKNILTFCDKKYE